MVSYTRLSCSAKELLYTDDHCKQDAFGLLPLHCMALNSFRPTSKQILPVIHQAKGDMFSYSKGGCCIGCTPLDRTGYRLHRIPLLVRTRL